MNPCQRPLFARYALVFLCFSLSAGLSVSAQKNFVDGYIVKKNKDSLRGQIDYRDWGVNPEHITFQDGGQSHVFGVDELSAFGVNDERYESRTVHLSPYSTTPEKLANENELDAPHDTTVFLQVVVNGKLSLWEFRESTGVDYYFITGSDGQPVQLRMITRIHVNDGVTTFEQQEYYKNQLSYLLRDCSPAVNRIVHADYKLSSLRSLVFTYNNCGKDTVEKRDVGSRGSVQLFPIAGYMSSKVKFVGDPDAPEVGQSYPASGSLAAGVGALFILPRNRQQLSFVTDVMWQHFNSVSSLINYNGFTTYTGHIDYSQIKLDVLFRYRYPAGKIRPFIEGGMANGAAVGMKAYQSDYDRVGNTTSTGPLLFGETRHYLQGWLLGAGVSGGRLTVEGRFENSPGLSEDQGVSSRTDTWYVLVSYSLF